MIKLTAGNFKGRSIKTPEGIKTRPTSSKVREALFNIIGSNINESYWLDLFAGSGLVGFEAISRGANHVTFIETDYSAFSLIKKNIQILDVSNNSNLIKTDAISFLNKTENSYNFIFIDPPYMSNYYEKTFVIINNKQELIKENGFLIVEHNNKIELPTINLDKIKTYKYGDTFLTLYKKHEDKL